MKSARLVLFLLALVVSVVTPGVPAAPADDLVVDDLPADTNAIERLTPEQARRLAADFPGAEQEIIVRGSSPAIFYEGLQQYLWVDRPVCGPGLRPGVLGLRATTQT